jgi:hypothetical protein
VENWVVIVDSLGMKTRLVVRGKSGKTDSEIIASIEGSVGRERLALAEFLDLLIECDRRELFLKEGYSSLYQFCIQRLRLSRSQTCRRIQAARCAGRFPVVIDMIRLGEIHLSHLSLLAPHLTEDNHEKLLGLAKVQSESELACSLARDFPVPAPTGPKEQIQWFMNAKLGLVFLSPPNSLLSWKKPRPR